MSDYITTKIDGKDTLGNRGAGPRPARGAAMTWLLMMLLWPDRPPFGADRG